MMKPEAFQRAVDSFKHRHPFQPFLIELDDGTRLLVRQPRELACFAGGATYNGPNGELKFVDSIDVKQVAELIPAHSN